MNVYAGPQRVITRVTLRFVPLTPIHIGDGTEWRPDEYLIEAPAVASRRYDEFGEEIEESGSTAPTMLCRFDQQAAMRAMTAAQRQSFATALDCADLMGAAKVLRETGPDHALDRVALSAASGRDLREAMNNPMRGGVVKPFIRSGGRPYIPGSSIKGAFRTALASAALPRQTRGADQWQHDAALAAAFDLEAGRTETDPLRFLSISDAVLPENVTLIDKTEVIKPGGTSASSPTGGGGIQMHYEMVPGRALLPTSRIAWDCTVTIDGRSAWDRASLFRTMSHFHWTIWQEERTRFLAGCLGTADAMDRLLKGVRIGDTTMAQAGPVGAPNYLLTRLGRFGHFESKSLEGVRRGRFPQAKNPADKIRPPNAWGLTRTITRDKNGNPIPFGWVIGWVVKEERLPC
jgi:CRISPR-associated protein Csm5